MESCCHKELMLSKKKWSFSPHGLGASVYKYIIIAGCVCSPSGWGFWEGLISKFRESDSSVLVLVHFVYNIVDFLEANEVAARLDHSLDL